MGILLNFVVVLGIILAYGVIYMLMPSDAFGFENKFDPFYFSMTTYSSVGYGDYSPKTNLAKALVMSQQLIIAAELISLITGSGSIILRSVAGIDSVLKRGYKKASGMVTKSRDKRRAKKVLAYGGANNLPTYGDSYSGKKKSSGIFGSKKPSSPKSYGGTKPKKSGGIFGSKKSYGVANNKKYDLPTYGDSYKKSSGIFGSKKSSSPKSYGGTKPKKSSGIFGSKKSYGEPKSYGGANKRKKSYGAPAPRRDSYGPTRAYDGGYRPSAPPYEESFLY